MRDGVDNSEKQPSRRRILKSLAASSTIVGTIGTMGVGATEAADSTAESTVQQGSADSVVGSSNEEIANIEAKYTTTEVVTSAVMDSEKIFSALSQRNILNRDDLPALEPTGLEPLARKGNSEGVAVQAVPAGDELTHRVSVVAQTDRNAVQLFLYPETQRRYAIVEQADDSNLFLIENDDTVAANALQGQSATTNSVTPQACNQSGYVCRGGCAAPQVMLYEYLWCDVALRCAVGAKLGCVPRRYYDCKTC